MLENLLRRYDNFGRPEQLFEVIKLTGQVDSVERSGFVNLGISRGTIDFLISISMLDVVGNRLRLPREFSETEISQLIIEKTFKTLKQSNLLHQFLNCENLLQDTSNSKISVQSNRIPLLFSSLRNLLVAFDFFVKNDVVGFEFYIHPKYQAWFLSDVIPDIESSELKRNSLEGLLKQRVEQEKFGNEAENFVLAYERKLRCRHPKTENIRIISNIDTSAGYDIQSYSSDNALLLDKFIEVKSYFQFPYFYWSENEVKIAQKKGGKYFLYLVDRKQMHEDAYQPIQITNPATTVFDDDQIWNVRNDGYFIRKID